MKATLDAGRNGTCALAYSPDGNTLATDGRGGILLWDVGTGELKGILEGNRYGVSYLAYSPDGRILVGHGDDGTIQLWDTGTGELKVAIERHESSVRSVAFSPDGRTLAAGTWDGPVQLWDVEQRPPEEHPGRTWGQGLRRGLVARWPDSGQRGPGRRAPVVGRRERSTDSEPRRAWQSHRCCRVFAGWAYPRQREQGRRDPVVGHGQRPPCRAIFRVHLDRITSLAYSPDGSHPRQRESRRDHPPVGTRDGPPDGHQGDQALSLVAGILAGRSDPGQWGRWVGWGVPGGWRDPVVGRWHRPAGDCPRQAWSHGLVRDFLASWSHPGQWSGRRPAQAVGRRHPPAAGHPPARTGSGSSVWPFPLTASTWPAEARGALSACGRRARGVWRRLSKGMGAESTPLPSPGMASSWPVPAMTARSRSGRCRTASSWRFWRGTAIGRGPWRFPRMTAPWPVAVGTARSCCGTCRRTPRLPLPTRRKQGRRSRPRASWSPPPRIPSTSPPASPTGSLPPVRCGWRSWNALGQSLHTLVNEVQAPGSYQVYWNARNQRGSPVAAGVYFTRLRHPGGVQVQRLLYLR